MALRGQGEHKPRGAVRRKEASPTLHTAFPSREEPGGWRTAKLGEASEQLNGFQSLPCLRHRGTVPLHSAEQSPVETRCSRWEMEASII